jgi:hypothetical protein
VKFRIERVRKSPRETADNDNGDSDVSKARSAFIFRVKCRALQQHLWDKLRSRSKREFLALWVTVQIGLNKTHDRQTELLRRIKIFEWQEIREHSEAGRLTKLLLKQAYTLQHSIAVYSVLHQIFHSLLQYINTAQ